MVKLFSNSWFKNISITKKLYFTIGIMAVLIVIELLTLWFSHHMLKAVRASVQQEGVWSKAQKDAINELQTYILDGDTAHYYHFKEMFKVHQGDKKAFAELRKTSINSQVMREGFVSSGIHEEDVDAVVSLFKNFGFISYIEQCIDLFWEGDKLMVQLWMEGENIHRLIQENKNETIKATTAELQRLQTLNAQFTVLELEFSETLSEAARWLENLMIRLLIIIALTVEVTGIILAVSVSRGISKGINEIIRASKEVAKGNFEDKATIYSRDEIGLLAHAFNDMIEDLSQINKEQEQFAYVASHDLQEPLRTVANFNNLLREHETDWSAEEKEKFHAFIDDATRHMQDLIRDLMEFSRVGKHLKVEEVDMSALFERVKLQLHDLIERTGATLHIEPDMPSLLANEIELNQLFQNLISNAIKFRKQGVYPVVKISYLELPKEHQFSIEDNGIGIAEHHLNKIFMVFQRLNHQQEYPGTGIGLATCKKIINLLKGNIDVKSELGKGSVFIITIPKSF